MSPRSSIALLTTSTRSRRCRCISSLASSRSAPSGTVTSLSPLVMMPATGWSRFVSNRRSRLVTMPTTLRPSTTGSPENRCARFSAMTSRTDIVGGTVSGSLTTPDSKRLTIATSAAWRAAGMFLWMMPSPPSCAMVMASRASVTVSMAADTSGMLSAMDFVRRVARLTSRGTTREWAGTRRTSSNVSAFLTTRMGFSNPQKRIIQAMQPAERGSARVASSGPRRRPGDASNGECARRPTVMRPRITCGAEAEPGAERAGDRSHREHGQAADTTVSR